jgi:hypothetical protein
VCRSAIPFDCTVLSYFLSWNTILSVRVFFFYISPIE